MSLPIIVGTGRCGSTMLSHMLHMHPRILSLSEFWNLFPDRDINILASSATGEEFWQLIAKPSLVDDGIIAAGVSMDEYFYPYDRARFDPATGVPSICRVLAAVSEDPDSLYDKLMSEMPSWPRREVAGHCRVLFGELAAMLGRQVIVERTGAALGMIPVLRRRFPDARFIFLHRDGPDCALSMSRHPLFRIALMKILADALSSSSPSEFIPEEVLSEEIMSLSPADLRSVATPPFDMERLLTFPIPIELFAWLWSSEIHDGEIAIREVRPDEWMTLRYEQLLTDTRSELTRLADFIGVPAERQWLDEACGFVDPDRAGTATHRLDQDGLAALQAACAAGTGAFDLLELEQAASR
jgi:Sulfotransferase family